MELVAAVAPGIQRRQQGEQLPEALVGLFEAQAGLLQGWPSCRRGSASAPLTVMERAVATLRGEMNTFLSGASHATPGTG